MSQPHIYDVVVVGGGMVGAAMARAAARSGFDTALIEARPPEAYDPAADYDLRVSAISPGSRRFLQSIDAWDAIARQRISPYRSMRVWEQDATRDDLVFEAPDCGLSELGHIIENRLIVDALWQKLDTVELFCPAAIAALELNTEQVRVRLEDGRSIQGRLLVAADGAASQTRQLAGIDCFGWSYQQRGVVATVQTEKPHQATAWQRFLPTGPVALLPLADGRCSIVWSASDALAEELLGLNDDDFAERLEAALQQRLGRVQLCSPRAAFPLRMQQAAAYCGERLVLVGDAAHVIHPLAGQGVNLGYGDAACLLAVLEQARADGRDLGAHRRLRRYERARKAEDVLMATATDGLNRLYASDHALLKLGRRQGSRLVNVLAPLKQALIQHAAG